MEQKLRKQAIRRYQNNEKTKVIYTDLNRSKYWFLKWLKCYQSGDPDWYKDQFLCESRHCYQIHQLQVYLGEELTQTFDYQLTI